MKPGLVTPPPPRRGPRWKGIREYSEWIQIALMFPSSIAVGLAIGYGLDQWWKTTPMLTLGMTLVGIVAGFYNFYRAYTQWERRRRP